jgi:hypothetical protein
LNNIQIKQYKKMLYLSLLLLTVSLVGAGPTLYKLEGDKEAEPVKIPVSSTGEILINGIGIKF